jgi:hypothetical protein
VVSAGNTIMAVSIARWCGELTTSSIPSMRPVFACSALACSTPIAVSGESKQSSSFMACRNSSKEQPAARSFSARGLCIAWPCLRKWTTFVMRDMLEH